MNLFQSVIVDSRDNFLFGSASLDSFRSVDEGSRNADAERYQWHEEILTRSALILFGYF